MSYDPKGPVSKIFEPLLANELASTFGIADDAQDTAEFISDHIGQGKSAAEICADIKDVINIPINEEFMGRVFAEIARLQQLHANGQLEQLQGAQPPLHPQFPSQEQPQPQPSIPGVGEALDAFAAATPAAPSANPFFPHGAPVAMAQEPQQQPRTFPSGPAKANNQKKNHVEFNKLSTDSRKSNVHKGKASRGGITKDYDSRNGQKPNQKNSVNAANLQRALNMSSDDTLNIQPHNQRPPKGRCPQFPNCPNRDCEFSHPTKKCFQYPNCKNPPGTCDYLHPLEDQELMAELNKSKARFQDRRQNTTQVELCKFGVLCSKELCPFGHPTPANQHAKVMVQKWCRQNKNCTDEECVFAHSSPNYQAPVPTPAPVPVAAPPPRFHQAANTGRIPMTRVTTTLEQCKFGRNCTSNLCPKRHATSLVACRAGYNCTRMNCTFAHPIMEECRFGNECRNKPCFFIHPDGRERELFVGGDPNGSQTFADQVMEQAVQQ